ncbi:MAG: DUF2513 domain-containing protein, partial [Thermohalobaculum sp.]|nr:DUF2513 domain-containing protein [Thermohalobaculum sp.]
RLCRARPAGAAWGLEQVRRNQDLSRALLLEMEARHVPYIEVCAFLTPTDEERERHYHLHLLADAGLISVQDERRFYINDEMPNEDGRTYSRSTVYRLTNAGHDYLEAIRDENIWDKTKAVVSETGGNATLEIIKALATAFLKKKISQHTGVDL